MPYARHALEALSCGLLLALLAPPVAAVVFIAQAAIAPEASGASFDTGPLNLVLLFIGAASAAYFLGAVPAFLAGLALPALRRRLALFASAVSTGLAASAAYFLTFGSHLLLEPHLVRSLLTYGLPSFIGASLAALFASRVLARRAEA